MGNGCDTAAVAKLIPAKLVVGGRAIYKPATIFVTFRGTILSAAAWWLTSIGHEFEKVLLAGVKLYARLVVLAPATEIFTVPVLTHKREQ